MSAFAQAVDVIHTDPNLSEAAAFRRPPFDWQVCRAVRHLPSAELAGIGGPGARGKALMVSIRASEIAETPRRGDEVRLDGTAWRVESSDPDSRGLTFRLALARI